MEACEGILIVYKMDFCVEKCNRSGASDSNMPELNDLAEVEKQKDFLGKCVSKLVKSVTNEISHNSGFTRPDLYS